MLTFPPVQPAMQLQPVTKRERQYMLRFSPEGFNAIISETLKVVNDLSTLKGGEYAGRGDRLENFRRNAQELDIPMHLVWRIYAGKHWDAVTQYIRDEMTGQTRPRSESIAGRVDDLIVYLMLLKAIVREDEELRGENGAGLADVRGEERLNLEGT